MVKWTDRQTLTVFARANMRFEVIDHRKTADPIGRILYAEGEVELSYQDGGKTLKVFITDPKTPDEQFWREYKKDLKHYGV
jgi:hypothetical protein